MGKKKKITKKQIQLRIKEIEDNALAAFCDDANYNIFEWLDDETKLEYERLQFITGESDYDPNKKED